MLPVAWLLVSAQIMAGDAHSPELEIRAADGEVTIHAQNLPVSQILDRLSSATGMEVTYEGPRPTSRVTMSVDGISEAEAILKLLEGLGVSYVLRTDATGRRVDLLIVSGTGAGKVGAPATAARTATGQPGTASVPYEEPVAEYDQVPVDTANETVGGQGETPDLGKPNLGVLQGHASQAPLGPQAPQGDATGPAGTPTRNLPLSPTFPRGVSYPPN